MKVFFRADASIDIGTGHVMRSLTLAEELRKRGADIIFISRDLVGNINDLIEKKGFSVARVFNTPAWDWQQDAEQTREEIDHSCGHASWIIIDHYGIDHRWAKKVRSKIDKIMVIDDIANRSLACDILLDQNCHHNIENKYDGLIPKHCKQLLGPRYALLRPEFYNVRKTLRERDGIVQRILVFFGGGDPANETSKTLDAIMTLNLPKIDIDVVVGSTNPNRDQLKMKCLRIPGATYYEQIENIAELMAQADMSIGAGGSTTWERCCLGLPTIVYTLAENQVELTKEVARSGAIVYLGESTAVTTSRIAREILDLINNKKKLQEMSYKSMRLVDGLGTSRVVDAIGV